VKKYGVDVLNSTGVTAMYTVLILGFYGREAAFLCEGVAET
jgi:hypothetical protein